MDFDELGWLKASEYRQNVLLVLADGPRTPKDVSEETGYYLSHVSSTISDLEEHDLVECLTPDRRKGKLYYTTERGDELAEFLRG